MAQTCEMLRLVVCCIVDDVDDIGVASKFTSVGLFADWRTDVLLRLFLENMTKIRIET